jgi:hypothetical protein
VELLPRKYGCSVEKRSPGAERGGAGPVIDEATNQSFNAWAREDKDHGLIGKKDAVAVKASKCKPIRRPLGENLSGSVARARQEPGNDRDALVDAGVGRLSSRSATERA